MTTYTLKLSFDLRQVTQSLGHEFILQDNAGYSIENSGPLAGTFNFQKNDEIYVEVVATSAAESTTPRSVLEKFTVENCTLVSIPAHMTEVLSLFSPTNACASVNGWSGIKNISTLEDNQKNTLRLSTRSLTPLQVVTKNGQWQISGYLSVELTPQGAAPFPQLYFFDPEGSAGNGGGVRP